MYLLTFGFDRITTEEVALQGLRRPDDTPSVELLPGEYSLQTWTKSDWWALRDPAGNLGSLGGQMSSHRVAVHEDGSITVSPSILGPKGRWHGWLERGVWRSC